MPKVLKGLRGEQVSGHVFHIHTNIYSLYITAVNQMPLKQNALLLLL